MEDNQKQEKIVSMFDDIAKTYDVSNRVLSFGIDIIWRKKACDLAFNFYNKQKIEKIVDVACGTGDMMIYWKDRAKNSSIEIENIVGVDPSAGMMDVAKQKLPQHEFIQAGAQELPLEDNSADMISISYGIRNVVQRVEALKEFNRVLKKDGLLVILEFAKNDDNGMVNLVRDLYMKKILPTVGGLISKNKEAYEYLPSSIDNFLSQKMLKEELEESGFEVIYLKGFSMNISSLFIAKKCRD
jgi:demethylmenaquinone methyltransferase/2-methoxy-6-polyprenyl-1,4-benzoquinol methylase